MDKLVIHGGVPLRGAIPVSGAKNAALPLMCAALLSDSTLTLSNVPELADIRTMKKLLGQHGVRITNPAPGVYALDAAAVDNFTAPYELVRTMRASVLVLGPLLSRFGAAKVSLPGGCAIGTRPIDLHLKALAAMGAVIELKDGYVHAACSGRLKGAEITFDKVSVGATENAVMAATLAEGKTTLHNAAREPEVQDLCQALKAMGASVHGIGTSTLVVEGVKRLGGAWHTVIADRIEAGTYAAAAAATGGEVELIGARADLMQAVIAAFIRAGVEVKETPRGLSVRNTCKRLRSVDVTTEVYPGFPTDMQAQAMAMMAIAEGVSRISETIFENRYMHVPELSRMGAGITMDGGEAVIHGVAELKPAEVMATDLRASVGLVIAALAARGETTLHRVYHLDRGYERLEEKLSACGARIERVPGTAGAEDRLEEAA
ncbi:MAG: UDP-N-acetylglucosamine 1-carboxyvinyltransferase [Alphaproteobacteria bacterium]|nr:UDP-N-acetylglucosamine 1-carboxyvinyltransferase [Alphaproteobacteria bacterium]